MDIEKIDALIEKIKTSSKLDQKYAELCRSNGDTDGSDYFTIELNKPGMSLIIRGDLNNDDYTSSKPEVSIDFEYETDTSNDYKSTTIKGVDAYMKFEALYDYLENIHEDPDDGSLDAIMDNI